MEIEVISPARGSITIKTHGDLPIDELVFVSREAVRLTRRLPAVDPEKVSKQPFGFVTNAHCETEVSEEADE